MEEELWSLTFHELGWLTERWRMQQAREDRRAALAAWVLASVHRDPESRAEAFTFEEVCGWLGHGFQSSVQPETETSQPPTPDELLGRAKMLNQIYGGTMTNGT